MDGKTNCRDGTNSDMLRPAQGTRVVLPQESFPRFRVPTATTQLVAGAASLIRK